jgi:plasmid maintenance system antidote protein VapI
MPDYQSQEFLFQRIKEILPPHASLVDTVAEILHVSSDSAYRRIRGDTPVVLDEARELCRHFKLSLDQILNVQGGSTLFQNVRIDLKNYSYEKYLTDIIKQINYIGSFIQKEIIYMSKDMPLFHNFYFKPLIAFRYFFWMKNIIQHPDFQERNFDLNCVSPEIEKLSRELGMAYNKVPSVEIWNTESINSAILQIEFYKESGYFASAADIKTVYESLEETLVHLKNQAEYGRKFMPEENPESKKDNVKYFYNRVILGDNTIMVLTDRVKTVFINYDVLNYMFTRDETFCNPCYEDMQRMMKKSTLISQTSEKQRNIFFNIMLSKIRERKKNL